MARDKFEDIIKKLHNAEIDTVERLSGQAISAIGNEDRPKGKALAALYFVARRREQTSTGERPFITWPEALNTPFFETMDYLGVGEDDDTNTSDDDTTDAVDVDGGAGPDEAELTRIGDSAWSESQHFPTDRES